MVLKGIKKDKAAATPHTRGYHGEADLAKSQLQHHDVGSMFTLLPRVQRIHGAITGKTAVHLCLQDIFIEKTILCRAILPYLGDTARSSWLTECTKQELYKWTKLVP